MRPLPLRSGSGAEMKECASSSSARPAPASSARPCQRPAPWSKTRVAPRQCRPGHSAGANSTTWSDGKASSGAAASSLMRVVLAAAPALCSIAVRSDQAGDSVSRMTRMQLRALKNSRVFSSTEAMVWSTPKRGLESWLTSRSRARCRLCATAEPPQ